jgi:hypothetical protein
LDTSIFNTENLLTRHRLSPGQINALLGEGTVTEEVGEKLRAMEKTGEFVRITDAFESAKVPLIPLKGPVLSYRLYGDPANRRSGDLDFLVREHHIADALRLFHELGYQPEHGFWPPDKTRQRLLMRHTNEIAFYHPGKQSLVELHWRLLKRPLVSHARLEEMVWDNPATLTFADRTFATMPGELELLYLVIHGGTHWRRS